MGVIDSDERLCRMRAYHALKSEYGNPKEIISQDELPSAGTTAAKRKGYFIWELRGKPVFVNGSQYPDIQRILFGTCGEVRLVKERGFEIFWANGFCLGKSNANNLK